LRIGLIVMIALETMAGLWQYFFPRSFYDDFPTVDLDPPFNEHLMADVGGLNLALTAILICAAVVLQYRLVMATLLGFAVFAISHLAFHARHFDGFSAAEVSLVSAILGLEVVLAFILMGIARRNRDSLRSQA